MCARRHKKKLAAASVLVGGAYAYRRLKPIMYVRVHAAWWRLGHSHAVACERATCTHLCIHAPTDGWCACGSDEVRESIRVMEAAMNDVKMREERQRQRDMM